MGEAASPNRAMPGVQRYRRKPEVPSGNNDAYAVRYTPGAPLDSLMYVARMADADAELAEAAFPSGTVLVVRWYNMAGDRGFRDWTIVSAGEFLFYSGRYDNLTDSDEAELARWYDLAR